MATTYNTPESLASLIRDERTRRGLSQAELASRIGTTREWVNRLEAGAPRLELDKVLLAADELGVTFRPYRVLATEDDIALAESIAVNMGLEAQYLTDAAYDDVVEIIVRDRLERSGS